MFAWSMAHLFLSTKTATLSLEDNEQVYTVHAGFARWMHTIVLQPVQGVALVTPCWGGSGEKVHSITTKSPKLTDALFAKTFL